MYEIKDVYTRITDKIVADLDQGVRPWMRPWNAEHTVGKVTHPLRCNGVLYKGINAVMFVVRSDRQGILLSDLAYLQTGFGPRR